MMPQIHRTRHSESSFRTWKDEVGKEMPKVVDSSLPVHLEVGPWIEYKRSMNLGGKSNHIFNFTNF